MTNAGQMANIDRHRQEQGFVICISKRLPVGERLRPMFTERPALWPGREEPTALMRGQRRESSFRKIKSTTAIYFRSEVRSCHVIKHVTG